MCLALVNLVMNFRVAIKAWIFLNSWVTVSFLRRTVLHEVKLVLTYVTHFYYRDNDEKMKWLGEVRGKSIMSTESAWKCRIGQIQSRSTQRLNMGWMFVAWIFIFTTTSRSGLVSIRSSFQWVPGTHSQGLHRPKSEDNHFAPTKFYLHCTLMRRC
jgi:hypothetical protein